MIPMEMKNKMKNLILLTMKKNIIISVLFFKDRYTWIFDHPQRELLKR